MKLSELVAKLQADLEANGDTEHVALCLAVPNGPVPKAYPHRLDAFGDIEILRDAGEYVNGMTYLVADYVSNENTVANAAAQG
ncbi:MAG TPA: hypothetical protein VF450_13110 [Noviherbaspirillum sp.]